MRSHVSRQFVQRERPARIARAVREQDDGMTAR
jgi:hypothetical protein